MDKPLALGTRVSFDKHLVKTKGYDGAVFFSKRKTTWKEQSYNYKDGIICGVRVLKEGYRDRDEDVGYFFEPTKTIKVYLVAVNLNMKPYFVPVDNVKEVSNG